MTVGNDTDFGSPPFSVIGADRATIPLIFNSPHSGRLYPEAFLRQSALCELDIRRSEDAFVDELFEGGIDAGAAMLRAHFPRAYLDVNREANEMDPRLFRERLPASANARSPRVAGGLGVIPRLVAEGVEIYDRKLSLAEADVRLETCYRPYHEALRGLVEETHRRHGVAILVDCHSMPSTIRSASEPHKPDFIVGDRFGRSASRDISEAVIGLLCRMGYRVAHNKPYAGGFITEHYGRPASGVHAVQIEVNRGLYLNERALTKTEGFASLKSDLDVFARELAGVAGEFRDTPPLAAE